MTRGTGGGQGRGWERGMEQQGRGGEGGVGGSE